MLALLIGGCGQTAKRSTTRTGSVAATTQTVTQPAAGKPHASKRRAAAGASGDGTANVAKMIGQTLIGRFDGATPPSSMLSLIRAGRVGGVILFGENVEAGAAATRALDGSLQAAAREGHNPPLLIMTDQEGGEVRRLTWAAPSLAASEMSSTGVAQAEGEATGRDLRAVGVNLDLAPVADVERAPDSFLHRRAFGSNPTAVAERACAFAGGVESAGVGFTLKHFPGLGRALTSTDVQATTINASAGAIEADLGAYAECGADSNAVVMVSSAIYPGLTRAATPAVLSREVYERVLPRATGTHPVTISDDLQAAALAEEPDVAQRAMRAGLDMLLFATTQEGAEQAFVHLRAAVATGEVSARRLEQAYLAVQALKVRVAGATPTTATSAASGASASGTAATGGGSAAAAAAGGGSAAELESNGRGSAGEVVGAPETLKPETQSSK